MAKLWQKDYSLDSLIESFTVGRDYLLDMELLPADCTASLAHASMLATVGLLSDSELSSLSRGIRSVLDEYGSGEYRIEKSDEDGHTALENRLVALCGRSTPGAAGTIRSSLPSGSTPGHSCPKRSSRGSTRWMPC